MAYTRAELKDRVAQRIDEVLPTGNTQIQSIVEGSYALIDDELDEAARITLTNAPISLVFPAATTIADPTITATVDAVTLITTIDCPADFLRFVMAKLSGFTRPVSELYPITNPMYNRAYNPSNIGHYERPLGFLVPGTAGSKYKIELFRAQTVGDTVSQFTYIPETLAENVPTALQDAVIDYAAYRVLLSMKYADAAALAKQAYENQLMSVKKGLVGEG
jgi:hypothetical protein